MGINNRSRLTLTEARELARHAAMTAEAERATMITKEARVQANLEELTGVAHRTAVAAHRPVCCQGYCPACGCCACCGYGVDCGNCDCSDSSEKP